VASLADVRLAVQFDYGQTHHKELEHARKVCEHYGIPRTMIHVNMGHIKPTEVGHLLRSELDTQLAHGTVVDQHGEHVSATFVPGRNIIFLAYAGSLCDSEGYRGIVAGMNAVDYSGYPDCRPQFLHAMERALGHGLRWGVQIHTPLVMLKKSEIIKLGMDLKAPLHLTWSCYTGNTRPCGACPSCLVRAKGFKEAGVVDPALI